MSTLISKGSPKSSALVESMLELDLPGTNFNQGLRDESGRWRHLAIYIPPISTVIRDAEIDPSAAWVAWIVT